MIEITKTNPALVLRKKLSEKMSNEEGEIDRSSVLDALHEDFHKEFKSGLKEDYMEEYNEIQNITDDLNSSMMGMVGNQNEMSEETIVKILNASSLANLFRSYETYYKTIMN